MVVLLNIQGKCAHLRAKTVDVSGHLPPGPGQDLTPATLSFQDINHDGKIDMMVNVAGSRLVFLNANGMFVAPAQNGSG